MAKKKAQDDRIVGGKFSGDFRGFINHRLTDADKAEYLAFLEEQGEEALWDGFSRMIDSGYVVSVKIDTFGGGFLTSITCKNDKLDDFGYCLTARAPDVYNSVMLALFKHIVLLKGDWLAFHESGTQVDMWG
jgi:hypothetical protein